MIAVRHSRSKGALVADLLEFRSEHSGTVFVEVSSSSSEEVRRGRGPMEAVMEAQRSLDQVVGQIGPVVKGIVSELRSSADWPDEVEVQFAVKISAGSDVIIARAGGEANFSITLRWSNKG
jgi:hypothetical protein